MVRARGRTLQHCRYGLIAGQRCSQVEQNSTACNLPLWVKRQGYWFIGLKGVLHLQKSWSANRCWPMHCFALTYLKFNVMNISRLVWICSKFDLFHVLSELLMKPQIIGHKKKTTRSTQSPSHGMINGRHRRYTLCSLISLINSSLSNLRLDTVGCRGVLVCVMNVYEWKWSESIMPWREMLF